MNCDNFQVNFMQGKMDGEMRKHLAQCKECRLYAEVGGMLAQPEPPAALDRRVLRECHREIRKRALIRRPVLRHIVYAAAAAYLVFAGISALFTDKTAGQQKSALIAAVLSDDSSAAAAELGLETEVADATSELDILEMELELIAASL